MTREDFLVWARRFPDPLMLASGDGRILACNTALATLFQRTDEEIVGRTLFDFAQSPPEAVQAALRLWSGSGQMVYGAASFAAASTDRLQCEGVVLSPRAGDNSATLLLRMKRHEAAAQRFTVLNRTIERLTEELHGRKQSEKLLQEQREWLQVTLSSIGDAVIATDINGKVKFLNGIAEALTGWKFEEAHGKPMETVFDIFNESTRARAENPVARVIKEGIIVGLANHTVLRAKDGSVRPIEDSAAPIWSSDRKLIGVVLVFHDVTEKHKAHAELMESERRFRLLTELNVIAAGISDLEGTFLDANNALLSLLGQSRQELEAGKVRWRNLTPPEHLVRDDHAIAEALARGACQPYEKDYVLKDGRRIPIMIGYALFTAPQRYVHQRSDQLAICYIVDITERKRAEAILEQKVEERTAGLKAAIADLEAFSYTVSHDLRAPLRSMQTYAQLLIEDHGPGLNEEAKSFLAKIVRSGEHLDKLITDILTYSRVSNDTPQLTPVDLGILVAELLERYPNFTAPGVRIEIVGTLPVVRGNEALLTQCFSNLLGNAIKFVAPGREPHVKLWSEVEGTRARVYVEDNGVGIKASDTERIFRIFERAHVSDRYDGTGIGLSVVRRAAEQMGGKVGVTSEFGTGSRFWLELASE